MENVSRASAGVKAGDSADTFWTSGGHDFEVCALR
jgi:hypothetical protein